MTFAAERVAGTMDIVLGMLVVSLALGFIRLVRGPTLPDRVVALDLIASVAVGIVAASAVRFEQPVLVQTAMVVALIAFLGTVAFAKYVEKRGHP